MGLEELNQEGLTVEIPHRINRDFTNAFIFAVGYITELIQTTGGSESGFSFLSSRADEYASLGLYDQELGTRWAMYYLKERVQFGLLYFAMRLSHPEREELNKFYHAIDGFTDFCIKNRDKGNDDSIDFNWE